MTVAKIGPVAVIGCGEIGHPVAKRLLNAGLSLVVCDPDPSRTEPLVAAGASMAVRPLHAAEAAANVIVLVNTEAQVCNVLADLATSARRRIAVMSTISVGTMRDLARHHPGLVDAPVSGGPARAGDGRLTIMTGGELPDVEAMQPIFAHLASHVIHCGPAGSAQAVKVVNNIICHANTVLMAEALQLGLAEGVRIEVMRQVMEVSTGRNYLTETPGAAQRLYAEFTKDRAAFVAILGILRKDLKIAVGNADAARRNAPALKAVSELLQNLNDETRDAWSRIASAEG